jgi:hypothetical protein
MLGKSPFPHVLSEGNMPVASTLQLKRVPLESRSSGGTKHSGRLVRGVALATVLDGCGAWVQAAPPPVAAAVPSPGIYKLDPVHTFVVLSAQHKVVGTVRGRFENASGTITVDKDLSACAIDVEALAAPAP